MKQTHEGLGYLISCFPGLTTTFVYREVAELRRQGANVALFSIHRPENAGLSPESRPFLKETCYLLPAPLLGLLTSNLYYLVSRPLTYLSLLSKVLRSGESPRGTWRSLMHLGIGAYAARVMARQKIRHIHAHFAANAASVALFASRLMDASFSFTAHAFDLFAERLLLAEKVRAARFVVTISEYNRRFLAGYVPGTEDKIQVVHCGIDPSEHCPAGRTGIVRKPEILSIGQLVEKKGFGYLLDCLKILAEEGVPFHCTIVGGGYLKERLERKVFDYGLEHLVHMTGPVYQEVARSYLSIADIFVLACVVAGNGDRDGIPVALMEAMATGIPVVATSVSGIPELVQHGETGLLVPERDAAALATALRQLVTSAELREELGANGRETVIQDFNVAKSARQLIGLFEGRLFGGVRESSLDDNTGTLPLAEMKGG